MKDVFWKNLFPRRLFIRSLLLIITPMILLQCVVGWVFIDRHWETMTRRLADAIVGELVLVITEIEDESPRVSGRENRDVFRLYQSILGMTLTIDSLKTIQPADADRYYWGAEGILAGRLRAYSHPFIIENPDRDTIIIHIELREGGVLQASFNRKRIASSTTYLVFLWMIGSFIVLITIALIILRNQIRPIRRLAKAMDAFGRGHTAPFPVPGGAIEVRQAIAAFRKMRQRLQRLIERRVEMLAAISHDLNTVLTRMKLEMALMQPSHEKNLLEEDLTEMQNMLKSYLTFAGDDMRDEVPCSSDVVALLRQIAARYDGKNDVHVRVLDGKMPPVRLKIQAFRRCLVNVIENATRYAKTVVIKTSLSRKECQIIIDDDGPGIPKKEYASVFRPFYRLDPSRNIDQPNIGMGLSIARDIVHAHGGEITLARSPKPMKGLRVCIRLPF